MFSYLVITYIYIYILYTCSILLYVPMGYDVGVQ